jgi:hypothetical protein
MQLNKMKKMKIAVYPIIHTKPLYIFWYIGIHSSVIIILMNCFIFAPQMHHEGVLSAYNFMVVHYSTFRLSSKWCGMFHYFEYTTLNVLVSLG